MEMNIIELENVFVDFEVDYVLYEYVISKVNNVVVERDRIIVYMEF